MGFEQPATGTDASDHGAVRGEEERAERLAGEQQRMVVGCLGDEVVELDVGLGERDRIVQALGGPVEVGPQQRRGGRR